MKLPYRNGEPVRLVSPYGYRADPITGQSGAWHAGIDLVSDGDKTICCAVSGTVLRSRIVTDPNDRTSEWGNYVCVLTDDGRYCYYCHMERRFVTAGSYVKAGDALGLEGSTGRSTGSHCHFEVRLSDNNTTVNAAEFLGIPNVVGTYMTHAEEPVQSGTVGYASAGFGADNVPDNYAADAVAWAQANGIIKGNQNGDYKLHSPVTRQDVLVFLYRAFSAAEEYYDES